MFGHLSGDAGGREEGVGGGDNIRGSLNRERLLHLSKDGVDRGVETEGFFNDLGMKGEFGKVVVGERWEVVPKSSLLFFEELFHEVWLSGQAKEDPSDGCGGGVLASHEKRDHYTSDFVVRDWGSILVFAVHKMPNHVVAFLFGSSSTPLFDDFGVGLDHLLARSITLAVVRKRGPWKHEVDRAEPHIQIMV